MQLDRDVAKLLPNSSSVPAVLDAVLEYNELAKRCVASACGHFTVGRRCPRACDESILQG